MVEVETYSYGGKDKAREALNALAPTHRKTMGGAAVAALREAEDEIREYMVDGGMGHVHRARSVLQATIDDAVGETSHDFANAIKALEQIDHGAVTAETTIRVEDTVFVVVESEGSSEHSVFQRDAGDEQPHTQLAPVERELPASEDGEPTVDQ